MNEILNLLWRLQTLDNDQAKSLKIRGLAQGAEEREQLAAQAERAGRRERELSERLSRARASFRQIELDLRALEARLSQTESRLYGGEVTNAKELAQLEHRMEEERLARGQMEEKYLDLMDQTEQGDRRLTDARVATAAADEALKEFNHEQKERIGRESVNDNEYETARKELLANLPEQYRAKYDRVHSTHPGSALVRILQGNCGGCHNYLAVAEIERAARTPGLATCENCGRLLIPYDR